MKRLLLALLCTVHCTCFSQEKIELNNNGSFSDYEYGDRFSSFRFFSVVFFTPGKYEYVYNWSNIEPKDRFRIEEVGINAFDASLNFTPVVKKIKQPSSKKTGFKFSILAEGYYRVYFTISSPPFFTLKDSPFIKIKKGSARKEECSNVPEIFLHYLPDKPKSAYEWIYGEVTVPNETSAPFSSYGAICYNDFELGMGSYTNGNRFLEQILNPAMGRSAVFALKNRQKDIRVVKKGKKVKTDSQEGLFILHVSDDWKTDIPVQFLLNRKKMAERTVYSAWYRQETDEWQYLATLSVLNDKTPDTGISSRIGSTFENFGYAERKALFSNMWAATEDGSREYFREALFQKNGQSGERNDYDGGAVKEQPQTFFLSSGGFVNKGLSDRKIEVEKAKNQSVPDVDFDSLNRFVEEILSDRNIAWGYVPDTKVAVSSGKASGYQPGEDISKSFDGNFSTLYHSPWSNTQFPVTLTYRFDAADTIDYMIYYPRSDGGFNGNFKKFGLWIADKTGASAKIGDYDLEGDSKPAIIRFNHPIVTPCSVKLVVESGAGDGDGFASCAEMEFYRAPKTNRIPDIFTDNTCSELKAGVTMQDINELKIKEYRELAKSLYDKSYPVEARVRYYAPYPKPWKTAERNKTTSYGLTDNPSGIYAKEGDEIVLFVGDTGGESISLKSVSLDKDYTAKDYVLRAGVNVITGLEDGLLYIMYHTDNPSAKPVKIHIATGSINGFFDIARHDNSQWKDMLNNTACDYFDVLGKYVHLTFDVSDFKKYTPDITDLINVFDSIAWLETRFTGLEKYNRQNGNRLDCNISRNNYYMFATNTRTGYSKSSMPEICTPERLRGLGIWGPAHEIGHINQTVGLKWVGLTEVSNNIYSMYVQQQFGNSSRLATEKPDGARVSPFGGFYGTWNNRYEKGFTEIIAGKVSQMKHGDVFCKLIPFWQLQLYCADVKGQKDFYADVHEQIRLSPVGSDSEQQLRFMKICCDVAQTDFTDFFEKWGMLSVIDEDVSDLSSIQNVVNYRRDFSITDEQVEELKAYASKYAKPEENIHYIHDECLAAFRENAKIKKGTVERSRDNITMKGWENAVVFEVYDGKKLFLITPSPSFSIPQNCKHPVIYAIPAKGNGVKCEL